MGDSPTIGKATLRIQVARSAQRDGFRRKVIELQREFFKFGSMSKEAIKYVGWSLSHEGGNIFR